MILPDTDQVFDSPSNETLGSFPVFALGAVNLELRAALYRHAKMCLSDNGAAAFIHHWMAGSGSVVFHAPSKDPAAVTDEDKATFIRGIKRGEQYPFNEPTQWIAWGEDTYDVILAEFRKLEAAMG